MANIDPIELGKWERGETERSRWVRMTLGSYHNILPKLIGWSPSPVRLSLGALRFCGFVVVSLTPIWIKFYDHTSTLSWVEAATYSLVLLAVMSYIYFYDRVLKDYKPKNVGHKLRARLSLELCGVAGSLGPVLKRRRLEDEPEIRQTAAKLLECIRDAARVHLGDYEGTHLEATLLLFNDANAKTIRVANRTTHSRPAGRVKQSDGVMAYYVGKSRKHRIVHDFLTDPHPFPKKGLSGDKPNYRSILFLPLLDTAPGGTDTTCVGVVTVDSTRPYHFWPGNGEGLVVELKPYLSLLVLVLTMNSTHRIACEAT